MIDRTLGAVRERERERELYFSEIISIKEKGITLIALIITIIILLILASVVINSLIGNNRFI